MTLGKKHIGLMEAALNEQKSKGGNKISAEVFESVARKCGLLESWQRKELLKYFESIGKLRKDGERFVIGD